MVVWLLKLSCLVTAAAADCVLHVSNTLFTWKNCRARRRRYVEAVQWTSEKLSKCNNTRKVQSRTLCQVRQGPLVCQIKRHSDLRVQRSLLTAEKSWQTSSEVLDLPFFSYCKDASCSLLRPVLRRRSGSGSPFCWAEVNAFRTTVMAKRPSVYSLL